MSINSFFIRFFLLFTIVSCNRGPKIISEPIIEESENKRSTGIFTNEESSSKQAVNTSGLHAIIVKEVLPTKQYVYMRVQENDEEYWIASSKQEVDVGQHYYYSGGLLKTNFESKEYNRIFDKIYLVSKVVKADHGAAIKAQSSSGSVNRSVTTTSKSASVFQKEGSIKISELVNSPKKYNGAEIQLSGQCTKVNSNIMGRNWIHIKDGSMDEYDLVITTSEVVQPGSEVTIKGTVALNQDFGSGYSYEILIENGRLVK